MEMFLSLKIKILSWLLHHANREGSNENFYEIKNRILKNYGNLIGYDIQFIEGKKCHSCGGTGVHKYYDWSGEISDIDSCWYCTGGWYKRPVWNILKKMQFGKYIFHQPFERVYIKPVDLLKYYSQITGYIDHNRSKYGRFALNVLFLMYEKGFIKRWYKQSGIGWPVRWYYPKNWINAIIYLIKHRGKIPSITVSGSLRSFIKIFKVIEEKKKVIKTVPLDDDFDLPF